MFYALYYGVMARDIAEICTEKMVSQIGVSICTPPEVLPKANRKVHLKKHLLCFSFNIYLLQIATESHIWVEKYTNNEYFLG